jgi:polyhydroxyalkanoate synthase
VNDHAAPAASQAASPPHLIPTPLPPSAPGPDASAHPLDLLLQSQVARLTGGVSPIAMTLAFQDWLLHLAASPGKLGEVLQRAAVPALPSADKRFSAPAWSGWPFNLYAQGFTQLSQFWNQATSGVRGVAPHHAEVVAFTVRQLLDLWSPSNFALTNPEVLRAAGESGGRSLLRGAAHWMQDAAQQLAPGLVPSTAPAAEPQFRPGREVALTPGQVVFRNELIELIQYAPQTGSVLREPVLIVPSWIMKYYILDLSPHNSLAAYLVRQGHTVFMLSWRNPGAADRNLGMDDYLDLGLFAALEQATQRCGGAPVHAAGYCLGGTLLAIGAAAMQSGRHGQHPPLASITLLAAQTDFSEPGELGLFIDDSELALLDALMWEQGYLDGAQMGATFQLLHARELVWSRLMTEYLLGVRTAGNDLMAWNADSTRLPYRMHSDYLHQLFLNNDLAEGRYRVHGAPVALSDIQAPLFMVATEKDHVSPWRSVYKLHLLVAQPIEFVLTSGGHNAGIVSEPGHPHRSYRSLPLRSRNGYLPPETWLAESATHDGSWWPQWQQWLAARSSPQRVAPPALQADAALGAAPGSYVLG